MARDVRTVLEDCIKELGGYTSQQVWITIMTVSTFLKGASHCQFGIHCWLVPDIDEVNSKFPV